MSKFRIERQVEIDSPLGDALLYREYTLALIWPRSCPEYLSDDVVSVELNKCAEREQLPWQL